MLILQKPLLRFNIKKVNVTISNRQVNDSGCCSVLVHIKSGYDIFSFRRDSTYAANLYFKRFKWYGKDTIKEYKTNNGYFFHTIITKDGRIISSGGSDIPSLNRELENLARKTTVSGHITSTTINNALNVLKRLGMGHFLIKAPNDYVGLVIYNGGNTKKAIFKMANGQYVSVPNHPSYYRNGYTSTSNPIYSAIHLATTDKWGVNRRNIITYEVMKYKDISKYSTLVNIYASTCRRTPDNIIFGGKTIGKYTIPKIPNKKYIGQVKLKNINPMGNIRYTVLNGRVSSNPISNSFKQKYNTPIVSYPPHTKVIFFYSSVMPFKKLPVVIPPVDKLLIRDLSLFIFFPVLTPLSTYSNPLL